MLQRFIKVKPWPATKHRFSQQANSNYKLISLVNKNTADNSLAEWIA